MKPQAFRALCDRRALRALALAKRHAESREALSFYARIASFQADVSPSHPIGAFRGLAEIVREYGPPPLHRLAGQLTEDQVLEAMEAYRSGRDRTSPRSFFGRALLQPAVAQGEGHGRLGAFCPACGHPPGVGCQRPSADGTALSLVCGLCFEEWPHRRGLCAGCGTENDGGLATYAAPELAHLEVQLCESCRRYLHWVHLEREPAAVPDVDEIAALPLDVWARERDYRKLTPSLIGI